MDNDSKIKTFKELMDHLFYDWKMTPDPQLHNENDGRYWVNKTTIFIKDHKAYLNYKMSTHLISPKAYQSFLEFFTHFYLNDLEFQVFLDDLEEVWHSEGEWSETDTSYSLNDLTIIKNLDGSGLRKYKNEDKNYSKNLMEKISRFSKMIK